MKNSTFNRRNVWLALLLVALTLAAYWPAMHGGYVWDDNDHISENQTLRSLHGLWEIWFQPGATCQYYPLTFSAFWAGYQLWGLNPFGYHLLNTLLHAGVALLLWQVLARLNLRGAWLAGALFALHPVCVMSVAWMTELKNTLSAALALAAGWAYLRFAGLGVYEVNGRENIEQRTLNAEHRSGDVCAPSNPSAFAVRPSMFGVPRYWFYALALVLFQLALFAKTAVSFLPVTLLLVTWWQRERLRWRDLWPLIPMLGAVGAMGWLTFHIEHLHGAAGRQFHLAFLDRVLVSGRSFWFYLGKLFYPHPLTFIYERWQVDARNAWQYLYPLATVALLAALWWGRRRLGKGLLAALLHFYVCTSLLILLTVLYMTRYTFVSDHWQYFGCMSVMAAVAAGLSWGLNHRGTSGSAPSIQSAISLALCFVLLATLGSLTWLQCHQYRDLETLWQATLDRNPRAFLAHNNYGEFLAQRGQLDQAAAHFQQAMQIQPDFAEARYNFGNVLILEGRPDEAAACYRRALEIQPDYAEAHNNLGNLLFEQGRLDEAIGHFQKALQLQPGFAEAHFNYAKAMLERGRAQDAVTHCRASLKSQPDNPDALALLAWVLATWPEAPVRNGAAALEFARRADTLSGGRNPLALRSLAAAQAECGRFAEAAATAQRAAELADAQSNPALAALLRSQLKIHQASQPFHDFGATNAPASRQF